MLTIMLVATVIGPAPIEARDCLSDPAYNALVNEADQNVKNADEAGKAGRREEAASWFRSVANGYVRAANLCPDKAIGLLGYAYRAHEEMLKYDAGEVAKAEALKVCDALLARLKASPAAASEVELAEVEAQCEGLRPPPPQKLHLIAGWYLPDVVPPGLPRPRPLVIAGSTMVALGAGSLAAMTAGLVLGAQTQDKLESGPEGDRGDWFPEGRRYNTLAKVAGAVGGVFVVTGITLLLFGLRKPHPRPISVHPTIDLHTATIQLSTHF